MAVIGFIVVGDRPSHGGTVISGDVTYTIDGQPIARIGDKVFCPRCKKTTIIISSRFPAVFSFGHATAYDQDQTSCGALLFSRHNGHAGWDNDDSESEVASGLAAATESVDAAPPIDSQPRRTALRFQEYFILHDDADKPRANVPYTVTTADGKIFEGTTDAEGRTEVVWTDSSKPIDVVVRPIPNAAPDPYHYDDQISYGDLL